MESMEYNEGTVIILIGSQYNETITLEETKTIDEVIEAANFYVYDYKVYI